MLTGLVNHTIGTGKHGSLQKTQFAKLNNGRLVYETGESDSTVYSGL